MSVTIFSAGSLYLSGFFNGRTSLTGTIETAGSTDLFQVGNQYFLRDGGGAGPSLKRNGVTVTAGQYGDWTPLGAEQTADGYQVAWKFGGADQYLVWNTDSNGNYTGDATAVSHAVDAPLQIAETTFQQDLNGDGQTGPTTTTIETAGSTDLVQVANQYFLRDGGGAGPSLKRDGVAVTAGQYGDWTPLGAEQTADGYQVAWKFGATDQYLVWNIDSNGNYLSDGTPISHAVDAPLQIAETNFQQDLNGDGQTGPTTTSIETAGSTDLVQVANQYFLRDGGGAGPSLKRDGVAVTVGQYGDWTPLGAEQTAGGYQVAWKFGATDQYLVWNTDSAGNYTGDATAVVPGSAISIQQAEAVFQQDLNGNGQTGLTTMTIETAGSTDLVQVGNQYFLRDGGGAGPSLKREGMAVTVGQFGDWTPLGAEQTASGYQVAWKFGSADQYLVWNTDNNGNYVSDATPISHAVDAPLQIAETTFQQDLNDDSQTGPTTTTIETAGLTDLVQVANQYFLRDSGGAGPLLKRDGVAVTAGQFGDWAPLGAEQTATGYQVAWKFGSADQYILWSTDSSGNWTGQTTVLSGSDMVIQMAEPTFQQDLNGSGQIGPTVTPIETAGSTDLVHVGTQFFLWDGSGAGPSVKYLGAAVVAGQFGDWTLIGAEQTPSGYQVAWKFGSADQYILWSTDSSGNWTSQTTALSGSDPQLQNFEKALQQDLNGNGIIPGSATLAIGATSADKSEGQAGTTAFTFTVTRTGDIDVAHSAHWAVSGAAVTGADFVGGILPSGTVSFAAGETSQVITVNVAGDTALEGDESFNVTLSSPSTGATVANATTLGTIRNDDAALAVAAFSADKAEGQAGTTAFTFTVTRTGDTGVSHSAHWAVSGAAVTGADFVGGILPSGTVSFAAGETSRVITVNVAGDTALEGDETFNVTLSNPSSGATIATALATGTIRNDETNSSVFIFNPNPNAQFVNWSDPTVWVGGVVPNGPTADVFFNTVYQNTFDPPPVYYSFVNVGGVAIRSLQLTDNYLLVSGSLSVGNDVTVHHGGTIEMSGGVLSAQALTNNALIQRYGQINISGTLTNENLIAGLGLTVTADALSNLGTLYAASGGLTVNVAPGGWTNLSGTTLTGGTYLAGFDYNTSDIACKLLLNVGGPITTNAATIEFERGGDILVFDSTQGNYIPLRSTLTNIASTGSLRLEHQVYTTSTLTVDGTFTLADATAFSADHLVVNSGGLVKGSGSVSGEIENNGRIVAGGDAEDNDIGDNRLVITDVVTGTGTFAVGAPDGFTRAILELAGPVSQNVEFESGLGLLKLDAPTSYSGAIKTIGTGDVINLAGVSLSSITEYSYSGNTSGGTLTIQHADGSIALKFIGYYNTASFHLAAGYKPLSSSPDSPMSRRRTSLRREMAMTFSKEAREPTISMVRVATIR